MSAVHLAYQLLIIQSIIIMSLETYPKKRNSQFFLFEFVLINPFLQLILKLDGMHESFMYYKILFMHPLCCSLIHTQNFIGLALSSD